MTAFFIFLADYLTKFAAVELFADKPLKVIGSLLKFELVYNTGAAFSLATSQGIFLSVFAMCAAAAILYFATRIDSNKWAIGLGLVLGGIFGNLSDRIFRSPGGLQGPVVDWISVPFGVTTLKEQYSDVEEDKAAYAMMSWSFEEYISHFGPSQSDDLKILPNFQIIGTSGTITTIAATKLGLQRYDRQKVDGYEMTSAEVGLEIDRYLTGGPEWRAKNPCIGDSRKDFIMSGAAILRSILRVWPTNTLTVADRGLREGILYSQMVKQGFLS